MPDHEWRVYAALVPGSSRPAILRVLAGDHPRHGVGAWRAREDWRWFDGAKPTIVDVSESAAKLAARWHPAPVVGPLWLVECDGQFALVDVEPDGDGVRVRPLEPDVAHRLSSYRLGASTAV